MKKKYYITATVAIAAALSTVLAWHMITSIKPQHQQKPHHPTSVKNEKLPKQNIRKQNKTRRPLKPNKNTPVEITHLNSNSCHYNETKGEVSVRAKVLTTPQECIDEFGKWGNRLVRGRRKRIFPIKITIKNSTNQGITLQNIDIKNTSKKQVEKKLNGLNLNSAVLTLLGLGMFGASIALSAFSGIGVIYFIEHTFELAPIFTAGATLYAGTLASYSVLMFSSDSTKKSIRKQLQKLYSEELVAPMNTKSFMFFVQEKNYKPQFDIVLNGGKNSNEPLKFNIKLPEIQIKIKKKKKKK